MVDLKKDIQYVKGVGPSKAAVLQRIGINTLGDLMTYYPRTYEDRGQLKKIDSILDGETALIEGVAISNLIEVRIRRNMTLCKLRVRDDTGECNITWFNQKYLKTRIKFGEKYKFYGKFSVRYGKVELASPVFEEADESRNTGKIIPIYPLTSDITQNVLRKIIENGLQIVNSGGGIEETLPDYILNEYRLKDINYSINTIHFPKDLDDYEIARQRLAFEELLSLQLALMSIKEKNGKQKGIGFDKNVKMSDVINDLPFRLTKAQLRVLEDIDNDMEKEKPMNRLLQGDVGSGKTIVSMIAAYKAVKSGYQVAIMAPTAILANQHLNNFNKILSKYGIKVDLLVSGITKKKKEDILNRLEKGEIDVIVGTHALLEENVVFKNLGLVVTDEQHRFGVKQRTTIVSKGNNPDVLVMTATPIPRTLALILYGDLDISIIDELPPNRKKIDTFAVTKKYTDRINVFLRKQIDEGRQVYVVCPLVEETEEIDAKAVTDLYENYKNEVFPDKRVEYLHGKMKPKEKDEIMKKFKDGEIDILISTTVVEVGVDVPNASVMVIENAERFGLAQLHQLRGRVGRGQYKSYCVLKYNPMGDVVKQRMQIMVNTDDGFLIAQKDLELRGTGEFFGTRQHGIPDLKVANLFTDMTILKAVQELAIKIENEDPDLKLKKNERLRILVDSKFSERIEI